MTKRLWGLVVGALLLCGGTALAGEIQFDPSGMIPDETNGSTLTRNNAPSAGDADTISQDFAYVTDTDKIAWFKVRWPKGAGTTWTPRLYYQFDVASGKFCMSIYTATVEAFNENANAVTPNLSRRISVTLTSGQENKLRHVDGSTFTPWKQDGVTACTTATCEGQIMLIGLARDNAAANCASESTSGTVKVYGLDLEFN